MLGGWKFRPTLSHSWPLPEKILKHRFHFPRKSSSNKFLPTGAVLPGVSFRFPIRFPYLLGDPPPGVACRIVPPPLLNPVHPVHPCSIPNSSLASLGAFCGTPLGFVIFYLFLPSVRYATLGFGVQRRWRNSGIPLRSLRAWRESYLHPFHPVHSC